MSSDFSQFIEHLDLSDDNFDEKLKVLGTIVSTTSSSPEERAQFHRFTPIFQKLIVPRCDDIEHLRLLRGVLFILRNLAADESNCIEIHAVVSSLVQFQQKVSNVNSLYEPTLIAYYQILGNATNFQQPQIVSALPNVELGEKLMLPVLVTLANLSRNDSNIVDILNLPFMNKIFTIGSTDLSEGDKLKVTILENAVCHESFGNWLDPNEKILKACQLVITSKEDWDNYQLIGILSWVFDLYKQLHESAMVSLDAKDFSQLQAIHPQLLVVIDCISELAKFNIAKDFLINYKAIEYFIPLLRKVHETIEPVNMTKKITQDIEFPHIKSILIEIVSYLAFENFEMQEKTRELHGIEIILSNCIIDDGNPFIKERAIICLKYLLHKNQGNQKLVASLEAQKQVDNDVLEQAGYQVKVNNQTGKLEVVTKD